MRVLLARFLCVWLGVRDETADVIIGAELGIVKVRDFKRFALGDERVECIANRRYAWSSMGASPWK